MFSSKRYGVRFLFTMQSSPAHWARDTRVAAGNKPLVTLCGPMIAPPRATYHTIHSFFAPVFALTDVGFFILQECLVLHCCLVYLVEPRVYM